MLKLNDVFSFVTLKNRKGVGRVIEVEEGAERQLKVQWHDANGKHYEWFNEGEFQKVVILNEKH